MESYKQSLENLPIKLELLSGKRVPPLFKDKNSRNNDLYNLIVNENDNTFYIQIANQQKKTELHFKNLTTIQSTKKKNTDVGMFGEVAWETKCMDGNKERTLYFPLSFDKFYPLFLKKIATGESCRLDLSKKKELDVLLKANINEANKVDKIADIFIVELIKTLKYSAEKQIIAAGIYKNAGLDVPNLYIYNTKHDIQKHTDSDNEIAKPMRAFLQDIKNILKTSHQSMIDSKYLNMNISLDQIELSGFGKLCYNQIINQLEKTPLPTLVSEFIENASTLGQMSTTFNEFLQKECAKKNNESLIIQIATLFACAMTTNDDDVIKNPGNVLYTKNGKMILIDFGRTLDENGDNEDAYKPFQGLINSISTIDNKKYKQLFWSTFYETVQQTEVFMAYSLDQSILTKIRNASFKKQSDYRVDQYTNLPNDIVAELMTFNIITNWMEKPFAVHKPKKITEFKNQDTGIRKSNFFDSVRITNQKENNNFKIGLPKNTDIQKLAIAMFNLQMQNIQTGKEPLENQEIIKEISNYVNSLQTLEKFYEHEKDEENVAESIDLNKYKSIHPIQKPKLLSDKNENNSEEKPNQIEQSVHINPINNVKTPQPSKKLNPPNTTQNDKNENKEEKTCQIF